MKSKSIPKSPGVYVFYRRRNAQMLKMQNISSAYTNGWTYVRMILAGSKLLVCIDNQIFLNMALRCARERPTLIQTHHFWKEIKLDVSYVPTYERR